MTHTKAGGHEVKNWREESFEDFMPLFLRLGFCLIVASKTRLDQLYGAKKMISCGTTQREA